MFQGRTNLALVWCIGLASLGACYSRQDSSAEEAAIKAAKEKELKEQAEQAALLTPGRVTMRRMNKFEYNATVRDLLGDATQPAKDFPADDYAKGFDSLGEALATSPLLVEKYANAAEKLAGTIIASELELASAKVERIEAESLPINTAQQAKDGSFVNFFTNATLETSFTAAKAGPYGIALRAFENRAGPVHARMTLRIDGKEVQSFDVDADSNAPKVYAKDVDLTAGKHTLSVSFDNDYYQNPDDRNLFLDWIEITQRGLATRDGARVVTCDPGDGKTAEAKSCIEQIVKTFGRKAWRRPLTAAEVGQLAGLVNLAVTEEGSAKQGLQLLVESLLLSPNFLYRPEVNRPDVGPAVTSTGAPLNDFELAARLSYFLWGSMPDAELDKLADAGQLKPALETQARRMLKDNKAAALVDQFAENWLNVRNIETVKPDATKFPTVTSALKSSMRLEIDRFVGSFFEEDRSATGLLNADYTFLNDALATHYGLPKPGTTQLTRVTLAESGRGSLLGKGGMLLVTSHPNRTSPVKRGKWVLGRLLCQEPPAPPPGVETEKAAADPNATVRERLAEHRKNPSCSGCHNTMDPIGLGLEAFDPVGQLRTTDSNGKNLDVAGVLDNGKAFTGAGELSAALQDDARFTRCLAEQLFIYGLGRDVVPGDRPALAAIHKQFGDKQYFLKELIVEIVKSPSFTENRGDQ
jgi:Protein of unknown function (DUF1592)/Protein of unknown function (DUF1588)/Protein of unknown function (DUF1587)/Protein of unknown function (DUF1585)/Protein of unknown function (DUF1595)/Ca-dependent carbohydrate-binding module xylan-binding